MPPMLGASAARRHRPGEVFAYLAGGMPLRRGPRYRRTVSRRLVPLLDACVPLMAVCVVVGGAYWHDGGDVTAAAANACRPFRMAYFMWPPLLGNVRSEQVRVAESHLSDAVNWQGGSLRGDPDRLGRRSIDDAKATATVRRHE